jgi:hypothetical protein
VTAVQVPAELVERAVKRLEDSASLRHSDYCSGHIGEGRGCPLAAEEDAVAAELRALLPQPAQTCPNCGHPDSHHGLSCGHVAAAPATTAEIACECPFPRRALDDLRRLIVVERDEAATAPGSDVTKIRDKDGELWHREGTGWRFRTGLTLPWGALFDHYGPLTKVLGGGA